jgi:AraC family transcriptional regulator
MEHRIVELPAFVAMGVVRTFTPETMGQIARVWEDFAPGMDKLPGRVGKRSFGLMLDHTENVATYMCAIEVVPGTQPPPGMEVREFPAARYATWTFNEHISGIGQFIHRCESELFPATGLQRASGPDFEMYDERWHPESGPVDYLIPVKP